jgi:KDO2-lipid IV(A) lauroyltransferase
LQSGRAIGLLLDQHISPPGSVQVDFFGRKAYVTTAITNMAMKYRIPIVPTFCLRRPDNRFDLWIEPLLLLEGEGETALTENTQYLTRIIEQAIRRDPGQWFWMHKRWRKTRIKK